MHDSTHLHYMQQALQLAELGRYHVSPNPMVGCVIVKNQKVIGQGAHLHYGEHHAEINALHNTNEDIKDATVYVTLEPCCHIGKTPPCVHALIQAGIKEIYIACEDPNPLISGKSVAELKNAGITVHLGLCEKEARAQNNIFFYYMQHRRPFVIAKWAMSLDGKTVTHINDSRQISNDQTFTNTHQLRHQVDAILIGRHTAEKDQPQLTARLLNTRKQPLQIILANSMAILNQTETIPLTDLNQLMHELGKREISSLLVEGGMTTINHFFKANLINQIHVYLAPTIISTLPNKKKINPLKQQKLGDNFYFTATIEESHV